MIHGTKLQFQIITTIHLYRHDPWEIITTFHLTAITACMGEREWHFYVPRDRKQGGGRPSRTTERGLWKVTGCDRPVRSATDPKRLIGLKKTLVYCQGRAPRGTMADRVMNEYRLARELIPTEGVIVLCKICRKATSMKELEQRAAAMEEKTSASQVSGSVAVSSPGWSDQESFQMTCTYVMDVLCDHTQEEEEVGVPAADKRRNAIMHQLLILRLGI
ncbi:unnamed protein product [Musa acuminata subsp. malaccensis]|uniref:(wild Malaysian banana) hypothetical protein n=1 Tax=Musa acuminata subsp. malaccensis TaxID=214687 RepID=A0A804HSW0_MUSAM|nr:unnamed protein product [Musa acuminata subsp. malaccensis]